MVWIQIHITVCLYDTLLSICVNCNPHCRNRYEEVTMKNAQNVAGLVLLSTVLFSTNVLAIGGKPGGDPAAEQTTASAPASATNSWLQWFRF